jgi:hypothetical protein
MPKRIGVHSRILNCIPSKEPERDWEIKHSMDAGVLRAEERIPESKDLRESWWIIGDQGTTGSCVGWASADSTVRWHFVKAGLIEKDQLLSMRYVWMASKEMDVFDEHPTSFLEKEGTSLKAALDVIRKYGVVDASVLPFESGKLYPGELKDFYALAAKLKIASYFNLRPPMSRWDENLVNWKKWLAFNGPILTRLNVDSTWDNAKSTKGKLDVYKSETARGGHAIALVGYTSDRFIVRNSWGTQTWGDKGFGYASFSYAHAAFTEAYGVSV